MDKCRDEIMRDISEMEESSINHHRTISVNYDGVYNIVTDGVEKIEAENARLRAAITTHRESFTDPDDHTHEDMELWAALETPLTL